MTTSTARDVDRVPIDKVHDAISREWSQVSAGIEQETGQPPLRASTLTLTLIAPHGPEVRQARDMLHQLASAIPSRAILIVTRAPEQELSARVWAQCTIGPPGPSHCYDVIQVDVPEADLDAIPNIIAAYRLPELPTYVAWASQVDFSSELFTRVANVTDRLIIDSERFDSPYEALRDWAMFLGTRGSPCIGSDLAWGRLLTWRELVAQSFDNPATAQFLPGIARIDISFEPRREAGALLLASWIASRLGCEPESAERTGMTSTLIARNPTTGHAIRILLDRVSGSGMGIRAVRLHARANTTAARILVRRQTTDRALVRIDTSSMPRQERVVRHPRPVREEIIGAELMTFRRDRVYEESLACAAGFARLCMIPEKTG